MSSPSASFTSEVMSTFQRLNRIVLMVLLVFCFLYYVSVFHVIVPWLSFSVPGVFNMAVLTFTWATGLYCYMFTVYTDPGSVPADWTPDPEADAVVQEVKRKGGGTRFCNKCTQHKPPRSHHCRVCQRCVLKMDHHCPWANNCIGHANYRAFFLTLIYVCASLVHCCLLLGAHALHVLHSSRMRGVLRTGPHAEPVHLQKGIRSVWAWAVLQTVALAIALPLTIALLLLLGFHIQLLAHNKTTIEHQEGVTAEIKALTMGGAGYDHPYDLGIWRNLHQLLGPSPPGWLLPPLRPTPGGLQYTTKWDLPPSPHDGFDSGGFL